LQLQFHPSQTELPSQTEPPSQKEGGKYINQFFAIAIDCENQPSSQA
jgi:hypothetical protein